MVRHGVPAVTGVDTRRLTRHLRDAGRHAVRLRDGRPRPSSPRRPRAAPGTDGRDLVGEVTTDEPYDAGPGPLRVVAYDFGVKETMLRQLGALATVTVVPASTAGRRGAGPSSPTASSSPTGRATRPPWPARPPRSPTWWGGCRSSGSASATSCWPRRSGARTYKLPFGHHGTNHPVQQLRRRPGRGDQPEPQLRGRATCPGAEVTHVNLNDGVVEGIRRPRGRGLLGAVPPRGRPRSPRRPLPVRRVRRP